MRSITPLTRAATTLCAATLALGMLTACDPSEPDPTRTTPTSTQPPTTDPSTTASTEPSATYQDEQIASAQAFVESFFAEATTVQNDGYQDWERLRDYFLGDPELWNTTIEPVWNALANRGGLTTGPFAVVSAKATAWEEDLTGDGFAWGRRAWGGVPSGGRA